MTNIMIIDGHGVESKDTFNFKVPNDRQITIYSYTFESKPIRVRASNEYIATAMGGNIPQGYSGKQQSRVGGTLIKDRILTASPLSDWSIMLPPKWGTTTIKYDSREALLACAPTMDIVYVRLLKGPNLVLSGFLLEAGTGIFKAPFSCLWMACR